MPRVRTGRANRSILSSAVAGILAITLPGVAAVGCGSEVSAPASGSAATAQVSVTPSSSRITVGTTLPLQAEVRDATGQIVRDATVFWSSSDTSIATVTLAGVVTARGVGTVQIAASSAGRSAIATLAVLPVPVASVAVLPGSASIPVGGTLSLRAATYDSARVVLSGRQVLWATSSPQIATVDASGTVRGIAPGSAIITATSEGKSGAATVTVTAPVAVVASVAVSPASRTLFISDTATFVATVRDSDGRTITGRSITWSSSDTRIATVSSAGLVTATGAGSAVIAATVEGKSATAIVTVPAPTPAQVTSVQVVPDLSVIGRSSSLGLEARAYGANGNRLTGRTVTWSSSDNGTVSIVSTDGMTAVVKAKGKSGTVTVTATVDGKNGSALIVVQ